MTVTQPRQTATSDISADRVRELLLEITYRLHATRVVKRRKDGRRRPVQKTLCLASSKTRLAPPHMAV
jgi:hypothetical protein